MYSTGPIINSVFTTVTMINLAFGMEWTCWEMNTNQNNGPTVCTKNFNKQKHSRKNPSSGKNVIHFAKNKITFTKSCDVSSRPYMSLHAILTHQ